LRARGVKQAALLRAAACVVLGFVATGASARADEPAEPAARDGVIHPTRVYWGDSHVHSGWSSDASIWGTTLGPEPTLRFARGEEVVSSQGERARLARPLDWVALTDHSESLGTVFEIREGSPGVMKDPTLKRWHDMLNIGRAARVKRELGAAHRTDRLPAMLGDPKHALTVWRRSTAIVETFNQPGRFTTLIGFEWTSNAGGGNNLHRNVLFRDGADRANQVRPFTAFDSENPEHLWAWMDRWEAKTGGRVLAIPHNGNLSNGRMFALTTFAGEPANRAWAEARARLEPLYEITQIKGDGETHPTLSPRDEFADYETWDVGNMAAVPKESGMLQYEYARRAVMNGLALEQKLGVNPFKLGFVGGTDSHTGLATADENNFFGKHPGVRPSPARWNKQVVGKRRGWRMAASGYTGVWATENTREAIWDALARREAYATTGSRITVRFFGGYDFAECDATGGRVAGVGYAKGVPMGGNLARDPAGRTPRFLVAALKDADSGNLDRIQIVKGWMDAKNDLHEKVVDVVWSGDRKPDSNGVLPPVGNTVDVAEATWTNTIGAAELAGMWSDPDFDAEERAFYYVRVLEIPTPRWTAYDTKRFGITMPEEVPMTTQERAYTSPVWYTPGD